MTLTLRLIYLYLFRHRKALGTFWALLVGLFLFNGYWTWRDGDIVEIAPFMALTGVFSLYLASSAFQELADKTEAHFLLLLPASKGHHFLSRALTTLIFVPLCGVVTLVVLAGFFDLAGFIVDYKPMSGASALVFLSLHSIYMAGSLGFVNSHFFMTTMSLLGTIIAGTAVSTVLIVLLLIDATVFGQTPFDSLLADSTNALDAFASTMKIWLILAVSFFYMYGYLRFAEYEMD